MAPSGMDGGQPLLARWTEDYDCQQKTEWWYVIKDTMFDINELKAKRRYEINKGKKNFEVRRIDHSIYVDDLFKVQIAAYQSWQKNTDQMLMLLNLEKN